MDPTLIPGTSVVRGIMVGMATTAITVVLAITVGMAVLVGRVVMAVTADRCSHQLTELI
ncbi:hypothetical protein OK015_15970 [Mycobacterium sp. Aquia_216]|uniref:hypothetical protein n=1 Tax=Mycobacterium sp. Aquia_216 TaxID=2991729 RepID=UPI00227A285A|nr:hypothetical protein [Mycobacterium sp. Aquia_216]WAJ42763.1 hypothetical protein OK015_15970 [Mycobacterium sp. Aquia_216]